MDLTKNEQKAQQLIIDKVNETLDLLHGHLLNFCEETKGKSVPMIYITTSIKIIKENFEKGVKS